MQRLLVILALGVVLLPSAAHAEGFWELLTSVDPAKIKSVAADRLWLALLLCFVSGILTSFTPCVYPMIPITINIFGRVAHSHASATVGGFNPRSFQMAAVYVAGMCLTYSALGLISGLTGSLFGQLLQSGAMLGFLTVLFFTLALGQLGVFKMSLPASWQTKLMGVGSADNRGGVFVMGAVSGLIVSPCVGPIIAGILAFVFESSNAWLGGLYFFSFSLGLGVLFLLIGGFSGILTRLPRSGKWMLRVNQLLAALLLLAAAYYGVLWAKKAGLVGREVAPSASSTEGIRWIPTEAEALRVRAERGLPMIIDFTAEWCAACHEIEEQVFRQPRAQSRLGAFVPVRIDVTEQNEENVALLRKYGVMSLPTIVFLDRHGEVLAEPRIHGVISLDRFEELLDQVEKR